MKRNSFGTKALLAAISLALLVYFGVQGARYFRDPLTTTLAYTYEVEESVHLSGGSSFLGSPKAQVLTAAGLTLAVQGIYVAQSLSPLEHLTPCLAAVGLTGASAWFFRPLLQPSDTAPASPRHRWWSRWQWRRRSRDSSRSSPAGRSSDSCPPYAKRLPSGRSPP